LIFTLQESTTNYKSIHFIVHNKELEICIND
jgi:hypothetical protein